MNKRKLFRKLVRGYRNSIKKNQEGINVGIGIGRTTLDGPVEVTGSIKIEADKGEKIEGEDLQGIEIPDFKSLRITHFGLSGDEDDKGMMRFVYPLIPESPSNNDEIMSYTRIEWNEQINNYEYKIFEPKMPAKMGRLLERVKDLLEEKIDIDFRKLKRIEARDYLRKQTLQLLDYFGIKLTDVEKKILNYYINRDFLGYGPIEPLMHDSNIEDISCDGVNIPLYIFHRNPTLGSIPTNVIFNDNDRLDSYVVRLAQLCGQSISIVDPLLQGSLPDGSRVQATLSTDIARKGSNFTVRRFTREPLTPTHLLEYNSVDVKTLALLWLAIDYGSSVIVSGGTASGKTTMLNILSLFIRPGMKIVSIEDTAELKLPHQHWIPHVARTSISSENKKKGEIDLFDLLKESMRQRPDYIIVGEVRGKEAYILFQQMATGHPSFATIHAEDMSKLVDRLITPPISLPGSLIENLDLIVFLSRMKYKGKNVKRLRSVHEVRGFDFETTRPKTKKIIEWNADTDRFDIKSDSVLLTKIVKKTGISEKALIEELKRRMLILFWLQERKILDFNDVSHVFNLYYSYPERVIDIISGEV
jgi:flagellar protein FlaI